jgi:ubiquinone biosynthesis protein
MRLRPELVLLQKTMVTVEGVARRIDPDNDIWAAADPVVRRWILRELAPPAQARRFAEEAVRILKLLARKVEAEAVRDEAVLVQATIDPHSRALWFALGAAIAGLAFLAFALGSMPR